MESTQNQPDPMRGINKQTRNCIILNYEEVL